MGYDAEIRIETQKGNGAKWCEEMGIRIDEVIDGTTGFITKGLR